ncbi:MAG: N-acetylmuramoyl-L-alanine amidase [Bacteroidetes bacterium]|nr:N-acetylmuramoyl-L-alanine amidase [Bacteroidota bacterium]
MLVSPMLLSMQQVGRIGYKIKTVVIDAGHGGHDHGCKGASSKEKDVALKIALKLGKLIEDNIDDVKVIYTRKTDVFVELHERAEIANRNKADLFICIHCNGGSKVAYGTETFVMGLHKSEDNLAVSKRENESVLLEKDYKTKYDGFDPNSPESNIIFNLYQNTYRDKSLIFASKVQYQFTEKAGRFDRGVKEAGFVVLWRTAMPSVLVETGFLTNPREEKFMINDKNQLTLATCLFNAFKEYKIDMEEGDAAAGNKVTVTTYENKTQDERNEEKNVQPSTIIAKKSEETPTKVIEKKAIEDQKKLTEEKVAAEKKKEEEARVKLAKEKADSTKAHDAMISWKARQKATQDSLDKHNMQVSINRKTKEDSLKLHEAKQLAEQKKIEDTKIEKLKKDKEEADRKAKAQADLKVKDEADRKLKAAEKAASDKAKEDAKKADKNKHTITAPMKPPVDYIVEGVVMDMNLFYTIQIGAKTEPTAEELARFNSVPDMRIILADNNMKRYTLGHFIKLKDAQDMLKQIHDLGFEDAFITPYAKGQRITLKEAGLLK